eukprot:6343057-Prymnesium_polylepis.1
MSKASKVPCSGLNKPILSALNGTKTRSALLTDAAPANLLPDVAPMTVLMSTDVKVSVAASKRPTLSAVAGANATSLSPDVAAPRYLFHPDGRLASVILNQVGGGG